MTSNASVVVRDLERITETPLTAEGREAMASLLASAGKFEAGRPVTAIAEDGAEVEAESWYRATLARYPAFVATTKGAQTAKLATTGNRTEQAIAKVAALRSSEGRVAIAKEAAQAGNPWRPGPTFNRSKQGLISNFDPTLAAKLRLEAWA